MPLNAGIRVIGLAEFQRNLRKLNPELDKNLKKDLKAVAQAVASDAASTVPVRTGTTRGSIRAGADTKGPYVAGGKKAVPWYGWLDFGTRTPKRGQSRTSGPWKGTGVGSAKGRFIYPAIDRHADQIVKDATEAFEKAKRASF